MSDEMNIFEQASIMQLRFDSLVGALTTEQLWVLPLTATHAQQRPSLDSIARSVAKELRELTEDSFVDNTPNRHKAELELKLAILKHIIAAKLKARKEAEKAAENAERRRKLYAALASKEEAELGDMSKEEIEAEIAKL